MDVPNLLPKVAFHGTRSSPKAWNDDHALWVTIGFVLLWTTWAAVFNRGQFGDNVEQFNWAQSLELGYHKHPPLPSWLLGSLLQCFGPSVYWAYLLAAACLTGTATFSWLLGRDLFGTKVASAGALLWGLNLAASQRAQLFNHNTVLVLFISATAWSAWNASRSRQFDPLRWILTGVLAAGAVLSKYQAVVPLSGIAFAIAASGRLRSRGQAGGFLLSVATLLACCTPHALWVVQHGYTTLRYASEAVADAGPVRRVGFIVNFSANQLRIWLPAAAALVVAAFANRFRPLPVERAPPSPRVEVPDTKVWLIGLLGLPVLILVVLALAFGVSLRNHWGVQALQFLGLGTAFCWRRHPWMDPRRLALAAAFVHAVLLTGYAIEHRDPSSVLGQRRNDTMYPARRLAFAAVEHWRARTGCPLLYVAGTAFDAGLVSLYSGGRLQVFDNATATPWVSPAQLHEHGALYVLDARDAIPPGLIDLIDFDVAPRAPAGHPAKTIRIGIRPPAAPCDHR